MHSPDPERGANFAQWNEEMVRRYDIDRYYEQSHPIVRWIEHTRLKRLHELAAPVAGDRILEVGSGGGQVLQMFEGLQRTGVDLSATMIARARTRLGPDVVLMRGSAEDLPLHDASFDVVLCTEVLEHTEHPDKVVAELMRVAAPGARVVVSIPNERRIDQAKRAVRAVPGLRVLLRSLAAEGNEWHLHDFDPALLRRSVAGSACIRRMVGVPALLPIRFVALLGPPEECTQEEEP